jgi:hypothetical protein
MLSLWSTYTAGMTDNKCGIKQSIYIKLTEIITIYIFYSSSNVLYTYLIDHNNIVVSRKQYLRFIFFMITALALSPKGCS